LVYSDENIRVSYTPTRHIAVLNRPSYSIIIECEGKRVIFSGDMSQHLAERDFPEAAYEECDLLICELAHFSVEELTPYLKKAKAKRVAFSHVYPLTKYEEISGLQGKYPFEVLSPSDMDVLTL
jgi:ribonuclease BN (tRNA processing enzyme)